jgi:putative methyltransferase (TIGR04325 family)
MNLIGFIKGSIRRIWPPKYGWTGDYSLWQEASLHCGSYDAENILEKVKQSMLKIKKGEALYERDSVLFDSVEYSWPLLSGLLWIAAQNDGNLSVADYGGSLGSSYYQNKKFLNDLKKVQWSVIEQNNFVDCGKKYIQDETLQFFNDLSQCITDRGLPEVLLLSCVIPYLEQPYQVLKQLMQFGIPYIIIDHTYFNFEDRDRLCVQRVSPRIYDASYPCWFLNYDQVKNCIEKEYSIISEHFNDTAIFLDGKRISYKGFIAKKL